MNFRQFLPAKNLYIFKLGFKGQFIVSQINPNYNPNAKEENSILSWTCPHCKSLYKMEEYPIYNCYCGKYFKAVKENNKYLDTDLIPHGCGLLCKENICQQLFH